MRRPNLDGSSYFILCELISRRLGALCVAQFEFVLDMAEDEFVANIRSHVT